MRETPNQLDADAHSGEALASPTGCAPSFPRCSLCRHSSEIRTGCANQRPSGSVRGGTRQTGIPTRDRQPLAQSEFSESQTSQPHDLRPRLPRCPFLDTFRLAKIKRPRAYGSEIGGAEIEILLGVTCFFRTTSYQAAQPWFPPRPTDSASAGSHWRRVDYRHSWQSVP